MPESLTKAEAIEWARHAEWLRGMRLESGVDAGQFEAMVRALCRARAADAVIAAGGFSIELHNAAGDVVNVARRPELALSQESWRLYAMIASKFGLDPASRAKLGAEAKRPERAADVPPELAAVRMPEDV